MADGDKTYTQAEVDELTKGLKANRDEALQEAKRAKAALQAYDGTDPEEYKRLKAESAEAERKKAAAEGDFKSLETKLVEKHTAELAGRDAKIAKLSRAVEQKLVQAELTKAIADKKGVPDLLLPYAQQFVKVRETDDGYEAYVVDEKGQQAFADGRMTPMGFDSFVEQTLMTKFPRAFEGTGSSGGGASKSNAGGGGSRQIVGTNNADFLRNVEAIAKGDAKVVT